MMLSEASGTHTPSRTYDLGILFVHGIGDQPRGSTLVEFATPLVEWLTERAEAVGGRAAVVNARLVPRDEDEPAHAELRVEAEGTARHWLMAEAWWAASFRVPRFTDLARWTGAVVPWTFGSHFGVRLMRAWRAPRAGHMLRWLGGVSSAIVTLLGGMLLSAVMLLVLAGLLILGLIPWERLRAAIARFQLRLAASVGDSYVLVTQPIESAAILSHFHRDLAWVEARCRRVVIVAHSQGGAVACRALQQIPAGGPRLLITFGSGLRKLEELEELRNRPSFRRGAALAVAGLVVGTLATAMLPNWFVLRRQGLGSWESLVSLLIYAGIGWTLFVAGIRDFVHGPEPKRLRELGETLKATLTGWTDLHASADPVSNGPLHEDDRLPPKSVPIVNLGSMLHDHTAYWSNRDEFVPLVTEALLEFDTSPSGLRVDPTERERLRARRRARVQVLRAAWWIALTATLALLVRYRGEWTTVAGWLGQRALVWAAARVGWHIEALPQPDAAAWRRSVGCLALFGLAYAVTRYTWSLWNRYEMQQRSGGRASETWQWAFVLSVPLQLVVVGVMVFGDDYFSWITAAALASGVAILIAGEGPTPSPTVPSEPLESLETSSPERFAVFGWRIFTRIVAFVGIPLAYVYGAVGGIQYCKQLLARFFPQWQPGWLITSLVVLAVLILLSLVVGSVGWLVRRSLMQQKRTRGGDPAATPPFR
jgi:hypothetical protein